MQEGPANVLDKSPIDRHFPNGLPLAPHDRTYAGFTAVNGDNHRASSFRPDESANVSTMQPDNDTIVVSSRSQSHGWRPDDRIESDRRTGPHDEDSLASNKRKRADSSSGQALNTDNLDATQLDGRLSPKRRHLTTGLDSAIDLTSPAETQQPGPPLPTTGRLQTEPPQTGTHSGQRSPIAHGEPPPKPRPETEASIAESLQRYQQTQQSQQAQQRPEPPPNPLNPAPATYPGSNPEQQGSPPDENQDEDLTNAEGDDLMSNDPFDPKKRKRNFSNRTKTGCHTCRHRKKKCDEGKPTCHNCERGGFACGGYGPKPTGFKLPGQARPVALQPAKEPFGPSHGPSAYVQPEDAGLSYSHWGGAPPPPPPPPASEPEPPRPTYPDPSPVDTRRPHTRDSWRGPPVWGQHSGPHQYHPPLDFQQPPPPPPPPPPQPHSNPFPPPQNYHPNYTQPHFLPPPLPFPHDPFPHPPPMVHYPYPPAPPPLTTSTHHLTNHSIDERLREKYKMLRGDPFNPWPDPVLSRERQACDKALDGYNNCLIRGNSFEELVRAMQQILDPAQRPNAEKSHSRAGGNNRPLAEPVGDIGKNCQVHAPFRCDYGYNLHIGDNTVIQRGVYLQDAASITIKERCTIGPDVRVYTMEVPTECRSVYASGPPVRGGDKESVVCRGVVVEEDVHIGGGAIIMPSVTIGRGAAVGAGSVVTKDVKPFTLVAGNPAKFLRKTDVPLKNGNQHRDLEIQEQHDRMKKRMVEVAEGGFR